MMTEREELLKLREASQAWWVEKEQLHIRCAELKVETTEMITQIAMLKAERATAEGQLIEERSKNRKLLAGLEKVRRIRIAARADTLEQWPVEYVIDETTEALDLAGLDNQSGDFSADTGEE